VNLGNIAFSIKILPELKFYFIDEAGSLINLRIEADVINTTKDNFTVRISLMMNAKPDKAYNINDDTSYPETGELTRFSVGVKVLVGSTLSQNGFD
jgi:hypothetical protein